MRSLYWALSTMSVIGFADILPTNNVETIVIIVVMFFGGQILNGLEAAIASLISRFNRDRKEFEWRVERTNSIMRYNGHIL